MDELQIHGFEHRWREDFARLNLDWLQRWFVVEPVDHAVLTQPEQHILADGGEIYFARIGSVVIGTCALRKESEGVFELTKMAVDPQHQGQRAGFRLLRAAIAGFHLRAGEQLFLESSSKLAPALALYQRNGFELQTQLKPGSHYRRSDVYMIYRQSTDPLYDRGQLSSATDPLRPAPADHPGAP